MDDNLNLQIDQLPNTTEEKEDKNTAKKKKIRKYLITAAAGLLVIFVFCWVKGIFSVENNKQLLTILSDSFLIVGVIVAGAGALTWVGGKGAFDTIGYGFKSIGVLFFPVKIRKDRESYYDYLQRRKGRKVDTAFLFIIGGALILVGIILTVVYIRLFSLDHLEVGRQIYWIFTNI